MRAVDATRPGGDGAAPFGYEARMLSGKQLLLGVSGSIAAYKAVYLARLFVEAGAEVWPILTAAATRFVGPMTFAALTRHRPVVDMWSAAEAGEISHVELAHRAEVLVLAPATADLLARLDLGRADDPLAAVALATRAPWVVAPAMESGMWQNPATQAHVNALTARGARFVMPRVGHLASGAQGVGRMAEPDEILEAVLDTLSPHDLRGQKILVTAGPTREPLDPVRFLSNPSSGKMGYAVARAARRRGAEVHLVTGPTSLPVPSGVTVTRVTTTAELAAACEQVFPQASVLIMAAAPADFRPVTAQATKTPKPKARFDLALEPTVDVLRTLAPSRGGRVVVGFAAETDDVAAKAQAKLVAKDLDLIVANDVSRPDAGFGVDTNVVTLIDRDGVATALPPLSKDAVADQILDRVVALLAARR
jgi:phosphopantothenoylcysteine decarboxylase/phosphopantothenate--cysteine ligase